MTNLQQIGFYYNLCNLFDSYPPDQLPGQLEKVIVYIEKNNQSSEDLCEMQESLRYIQKGFEAMLSPKMSWGMCLANKNKNQTISLRPMFEVLESKECHQPCTEFKYFLPSLKTEIRKNCLNSESIEQYNEVVEFLDDLEDYLVYDQSVQAFDLWK